MCCFYCTPFLYDFRSNPNKPKLLQSVFCILFRVMLLHCFLFILPAFIYWPKNETSALHLCLFIPNKCSYFIQLFCFNNVDHLPMLCTKQKSIIRRSLAPITTPQAPVPKFRKSQNQYLVCPPFSLSVASLNGHTAELLWVPCLFSAVTTAVINLPRKGDVTKRQSRPCIVTRRSYLVGRLVWAPVALNISQRCHCLRRFFFQLSGGQQHAHITLTPSVLTSWHGFPVIKREKSILFDVFHVTTTLSNE